jgi:hypothetical protein
LAVHKLLLVHKQAGNDNPMFEAEVRDNTASASNLFPWKHWPLENNKDINI